MSFLETMLHGEGFVLLFITLMLFRIIVLSFLEYRFVAHSFDRYRVIASDITTMVVYILLVFPAAQFLSNYIGIAMPLYAHINDIPLVLRVIMYMIVGDFAHYWIHRFMHLPHVWRVHKWHHTPDHMSWMAGFRASVLDTTLVNLGFIFAWPLLGTVSPILGLFLLIFGLLLNDWMHLNVRFRMRLLDGLFVTPRYHHIHHSTDPAHYTKNLAPMFPIWDKLFGTYIDPDTIDKPLSFGIQEKVPLHRLIIGV